MRSGFVFATYQVVATTDMYITGVSNRTDLTVHRLTHARDRSIVIPGEVSEDLFN